jgi:D-serine deaminase-like pyridoxal phosphate-dependent protein
VSSQTTQQYLPTPWFVSSQTTQQYLLIIDYQQLTINMNRKKFIINTGLALGGIAAGLAAVRLSKKKSGNYSAYFSKLNQSLKDYKRAIPYLIIDLDALDHNLAEIKKMIPADKHFRIVVKSLPSLPLLDYIMAQTGTKKLMSFHQPFLSKLSEKYDHTIDILIGKPMPVKTAAYYYETLQTPNGFDPAKQLQWLVDTPQRIVEYIGLSKAKKLTLRLNVEIDVGLHRGGFKTIEDLTKGLQLIQDNPDYVTFSGFMGYDAHIAKVPSILLTREDAFEFERNFYENCKKLVQEKFPTLWQPNLTFNGAGSPTVALHHAPHSPINDISAGSFAVKPTDFDIDTLTNMQPASFIATPILKKEDNTTLPSLENFDGLLNLWDPNMKKSYYLYGGSWMADFHEPVGIAGNAIFGKSTNQVMINSSEDTALEVDDFVFLRPHQSEFVFLQFGNILTARHGKIESEWEILTQ